MILLGRMYDIKCMDGWINLSLAIASIIKLEGYIFPSPKRIK